MSIFRCQVCDESRDADHVGCYEWWNDSLICGMCKDEIEASEAWTAVHDFYISIGRSEQCATDKADGHCKLKWGLLGHV